MRGRRNPRSILAYQYTHVVLAYQCVHAQYRVSATGGVLEDTQMGVSRRRSIFLSFFSILGSYAALKLLLSQWRKQQLIKQVALTYPIPKSFRTLSGLLFGFVVLFRKNYYRLWDHRLELFEQASEETGKKEDTIQPLTPFWNSSVGVWTRDPKLVKLTLRDEFDSFVKADFLRDNLRDFLGDGIFIVNHGTTSDENSKWFFQRKTASKIFTKKVFTGHMYDCFLKNTDKFLQLLEDRFEAEKDQTKESKNRGGSILYAMKRPIYGFTLDSIGNIGFGVDLNTMTATKEVPFSRAFDEMTQNSALRSLKPGFQYFPYLYASERKVMSSMKVLNRFCYELIADRSKDPTINEKGDILSLFMQTDSTLEKKFLRDIVLSFVIAGRDVSVAF